MMTLMQQLQAAEQRLKELKESDDGSQAIEALAEVYSQMGQDYKRYADFLYSSAWRMNALMMELSIDDPLLTKLASVVPVNVLTAIQVAGAGRNHPDKIAPIILSFLGQGISNSGQGQEDPVVIKEGAFGPNKNCRGLSDVIETLLDNNGAEETVSQEAQRLAVRAVEVIFNNETITPMEKFSCLCKVIKRCCDQGGQVSAMTRWVNTVTPSIVSSEWFQSLEGRVPMTMGHMAMTAGITELGEQIVRIGNPEGAGCGALLDRLHQFGFEVTPAYAQGYIEHLGGAFSHHLLAYALCAERVNFDLNALPFKNVSELDISHAMVVAQEYPGADRSRYFDIMERLARATPHFSIFNVIIKQYMLTQPDFPVQSVVRAVDDRLNGFKNTFPQVIGIVRLAQQAGMRIQKFSPQVQAKLDHELSRSLNRRQGIFNLLKADLPESAFAWFSQEAWRRQIEDTLEGLGDTDTRKLAQVLPAELAKGFPRLMSLKFESDFGM